MSRHHRQQVKRQRWARERRAFDRAHFNIIMDVIFDDTRWEPRASRAFGYQRPRPLAVEVEPSRMAQRKGRKPRTLTDLVRPLGAIGARILAAHERATR